MPFNERGDDRMSFTATGPTEVQRVTAPEPPPPVIDSPFVGRMEFEGGFPTDATVQRVYDQLDFQRACQVFLRQMMGASMYAFREGIRRDLGISSAHDFAVMHLDASGLALTGNSETVYGFNFLELKDDGPTVIDVPPRMLGFLNDEWMRPIEDVGLAGPDQGQGGRYLVLPPGFEGDVPEEDGSFAAVLRSQTYRAWFVLRAFMAPGGDAEPAKETLKQVRIYPWEQRDDPPAMRFIDGSGVPYDTIHAIDGRYFDHVAAMIDYEPADAISAEEAASLAQIGIRKGEPFAPDERMRGILDEAARVGSVMAFSICNAPRGEHLNYPDRQWFGTVAGYPWFVDDAGRPMVDEMVQMAWFGTGRAKAMGNPKPGTGSAYTWAYRDVNGDWLNPARTYRLNLPAPIPAKNFWSVVVYDLWTRSMLANGQAFPSRNSYAEGLRTNDDGSIDIYIGPEPPEGYEDNWIRTLPDTGWFPLLRLYGPTEAWFDHSWKPETSNRSTRRQPGGPAPRERREPA